MTRGKTKNVFTEPEVLKKIREENNRESCNIRPTNNPGIKLDYVLSYFSEHTFAREKEVQTKKIEITALANEARHERIGIVGEMGAGKTSSMKALLKQLNATDVLPIFIPFKYLTKLHGENLSIVDVILKSPVLLSLDLDEESVSEFTHWFRKNHSKVCFLLDALDEANYNLADIQNRNLGIIQIEEKHPIDEIVGAILHSPHDPDKPRWMSVVSTRECTARDLPKAMAPDQCYAIEPWDVDQRREFAKSLKYTAEKGDKGTQDIWGRFQRIVQSNFCFEKMSHNPLVFQCMFEYIREGHDIQNHTALLSYVIIKMYHSAHIQEVDVDGVEIKNIVQEKFRVICMLAVKMVIEYQVESLPADDFKKDPFTANQLDLLKITSHPTASRFRGNDKYEFNDSMIAYYCAAVGLYVFSCEEEFKKLFDKMVASKAVIRKQGAGNAPIPYFEVLKFLFGCFNRESKCIFLDQLPSTKGHEKKLKHIKQTLKQILCPRIIPIRPGVSTPLTATQIFEMLYEMRDDDFTKDMVSGRISDHLWFNKETFTDTHVIESFCYVMKFIDNDKPISFKMTSCTLDKNIEVVVKALKNKTITEIIFEDCNKIGESLHILADLKLGNSKIVAVKSGMTGIHLEEFMNKLFGKSKSIYSLDLSNNKLGGNHTVLGHKRLNLIKHKLVVNNCGFNQNPDAVKKFFTEELKKCNNKPGFVIQCDKAVFKWKSKAGDSKIWKILTFMLMIVIMLMLWFYNTHDIGILKRDSSTQHQDL